MTAESHAMLAILVTTLVGCAIIVFITEWYALRHFKKLLRELEAMAHGDSLFAGPRKNKEITK